MKKKTAAKEALEMQKRAGIITESEYRTRLKLVTEAEEDDEDYEDDEEEQGDGDADDTARKMANYFQKISKPNPEPPVWKSVLAADKKMLAFIDKKIKQLYQGAEKLKDIGNPIWLTDKEAETTIPIAVYKWNDPDKPEDVPDFESAQEARDWYEENSFDLDLDTWIIEIAVQKIVKSGDIAYWEILVSGETNDPYAEPTGFLTGEYAVDTEKSKNQNAQKYRFPSDYTEKEIEELVSEYMKNGSKGDLYLKDSVVTSLPKGLKVGGSLNLMGSSILSLPDNLEIGETLVIHDTNITSLPKNLKIGRHLLLASSIFNDTTKIKSLPTGLEVGGTIQMGPSKISSLPKDLKAGELDVTDTPLEKYTEKQIKAMAPGVKEVRGAAESSMSKIARAGGLPKGTPGADDDTEYGDRTNE